MIHVPNETCRMSGSSRFSSGFTPVVALWYRVGDVAAAEGELALHHVAINVHYMLSDGLLTINP